MIVIFNTEFVNKLGRMLQSRYETNDDDEILPFFTSQGMEKLNNYISAARRNRPKHINIRHFFNVYIFETNDSNINDEYTHYKGTAEKRFKGKGWQNDEIERVYSIFNKDSAPILLDVDNFHDRLNISGQLLYSSNLKICLSVMVDKSVKDLATHTELDGIIKKDWIPKDIIEKAKESGQSGLSEYKIRDCLEKHIRSSPAFFIKDTEKQSYRIDWDNLILYENQHINIP